MPTSPDRVKQVETTRERYGKDHYQKIGSQGGKKSQTKFTSETASKAARARWAKVREQANKEKGE